MDQRLPGPDPGHRWGAVLLVTALVGVLLVCLLVCAALSGDWLAAAVALGCGSLGLAGNIVLTGRLRQQVSRQSDERQFHQAHLDAIVGTTADAILTCGEDGTILSANHATSNLFGYPAADLIGARLSLLIPGGLLAEVATDQCRMFGAAAALHGRHRDGRELPVKVGVSKVRVEGAALFTVIIHDQSEVQRLREQGETAARGRTAFLHHMSHELRTPLNAVLGTADLLRGTPLAGDQQRLVDLLVQSGEELLASVELVMDYGRLEAGRLDLEARPFSLRSVLGDLIAPLAPRASARGLALTHTVDPTVPDQVIGDPARLGQALRCLIDNAIKFTPAGEVAVTVAPQVGDPSARVVVFSVRDTGIGIAAADQQRIFRPFEQADSSPTRRAGGMGLGLSLVAGLTRLMGGRISVESSLGAGSTFRLQLPLRPLDGGGREGRPVLLALSDAAERAGYEATIRGLGLEPVGVPTGRAALAEVLRGVIQGQPFGVVVLEQRLPDVLAEDWMRQLNGCSDWRGAVVLLHDGPRDGARCPAGVTAVLERRRAAEHLGQMVRQLVFGG